MADQLKARTAFEEFQNEYFNKNSQAEENRLRETKAAMTIQSWFRGCKVRAYLSFLHEKAVIIQKVWWGFKARTRARQMVKEAYFIMKMNLYNAMAVRIQRHWRGFFIRKYVHNFYVRKLDLEKLLLKNQMIRREMEKIDDLEKRQSRYLVAIKEQESKITEAEHLHYLLSTKQSPGVFNSPFKPGIHEMEQMLKQVKYWGPTRRIPRDRPCSPHICETGAHGVSGIFASPCRKPSRSHISKPVLPPISRKKQRLSMDELKQLPEQLGLGSLPHNPDLKSLQTSCAHLEEIRNQLHHHQSVKLPSVIQLVYLDSKKKEHYAS